MNTDMVGFLFALVVLIRYELAPRAAAHIAHRRELAAECARVGHRFADPIAAMGSVMRTCTRCGKQEHRNELGEWH